MPLTIIVGFGLVVARRPDALFDPQLYAEDGKYWFQQAWNSGPIAALAMPHAGYLATLERLVALGVPFLGLRGSPLLFNLVAIGIQVAPAAFFVSRRAEALVPQLSARVVIAAVYLVLPNSEINANLTNAQWHLAVLAFLLLVASPPRTWWAKSIDAFIVALTCVTGPFGIVLAAVALILWWTHRERHTAFLVGAAAVATTVQVVAIILAADTRSNAQLGASMSRFVAILVNRFALAGFLAEDTHGPLLVRNFHSLIWGLPILAAAGAVIAIALLRGPLVLRLFIVMGFVVMLAGVFEPATDPRKAAWPILAHSQYGGRYFFIAALALVMSSLWLVTRLRRTRMRTAGVAVVCALLAVGIGVELQYPAWPPSHRDYYAHVLDTAPRGSVVSVPVWPNSFWAMQLVARGR